MSNQEKYEKVFISIFDVDASVLNEGFVFKGNEKWDSVTHLSLISALEDEFDVMFEAEDILHYGSYLNGMDILRRYGVDL